MTAASRQHCKTWTPACFTWLTLIPRLACLSLYKGRQAVPMRGNPPPPPPPPAVERLSRTACTRSWGPPWGEGGGGKSA